MEKAIFFTAVLLYFFSCQSEGPIEHTKYVVFEDIPAYYADSMEIAFETVDNANVSYMFLVEPGEIIGYKVLADKDTRFLKIYSKAKRDDTDIIDFVASDDSCGVFEDKYYVVQKGFAVITSKTGVSQYCKHYKKGEVLHTSQRLPNQLKFDVTNKKTILSYSDAEASIYDNRRCSGGAVIQVADNMYYMLYNAQGTNNTQAYNICLAYSKDGITWTRGIPQGVNAPYPGTNVVIGISTPEKPIVGEFDFEFINEFSVCKTIDVEYPYRMFASIRNSNPNTIKGQSCYMFKSVDLIHWTPVRKVLDTAHDCYSAIFSQNNLIKVYLRMWDYGQEKYSEQRIIGVMWVDLFGNVVVPPSYFFGHGLYQSSATDIGNGRELMLPSRLYTSDNIHGDGTVECYIVDGEHISYAPSFDLDRMSNTADGWRVVRGLVSINNQQYCLYTQYEKKHGEAENFTSIMLCPIEWVTYGAPNVGG